MVLQLLQEEGEVGGGQRGRLAALVPLELGELLAVVAAGGAGVLLRAQQDETHADAGQRQACVDGVDVVLDLKYLARQLFLLHKLISDIGCTHHLLGSGPHEEDVLLVVGDELPGVVDLEGDFDGLGPVLLLDKRAAVTLMELCMAKKPEKYPTGLLNLRAEHIQL